MALLSGQLHAASPPNPVADIPWDEEPARSGDQQSFAGVAAIAAAFDNARRAEERQLGLADGALGTLALPGQSDWDALGPGARMLHIANAERVARGGVAYPGGAPRGLPFAAVERHLDALAQAYADYQIANDFWAHEAPADGPPPFAGSDPFGRIDADPVLGEGAGRGGADCHSFLPQAENLAVFGSTGAAVPLPVERALYGFLYADAGSRWGHRTAMLLQDVALNGQDGFVDDVGAAGSEGYIGVGVAGVDDGSYAAPFGSGWRHATVVVFEMIDPVAGAGCGYDVLGG